MAGVPDLLSLILLSVVAASTLSPATATQARDDTGTVAQGGSVVLTPLANDAAAPGARLRPATLGFVGEGPVLAVPGEGLWTLEGGGRVQFTASWGFVGTTTPVAYEVRDSAGRRVTASMTVRVSAATSGPDVAVPGEYPRPGDDDGGGVSGRRLGYLAGGLLISLGFFVLRRRRPGE